MSLLRSSSILTLALLFIFPLQVQAETRYVTDVLVITMREAPKRSAEITGHMRSGDAMKVLEENKKKGYTLVKAASGEKGWVMSRYTSPDLPKAKIIARLEAKISGLQKKVQGAKEQKQKFALSEKTQKQELSQLEIDNQKLVAQISTMEQAVSQAQGNFTDLQNKAKGVAEVYAERDELLARQADIKQKIAFLEAENDDLVQTGRILWFLAGFGVFLVGWLMGKIGRGKQRQSSLSL